MFCRALRSCFSSRRRDCLGDTHEMFQTDCRPVSPRAFLSRLSRSDFNRRLTRGCSRFEKTLVRLLVARGVASARTLSRNALEAHAQLDRDGRLHVSERRFRIVGGRQFQFLSLAEIDAARADRRFKVRGNSNDNSQVSLRRVRAAAEVPAEVAAAVGRHWSKICRGRSNAAVRADKLTFFSLAY